MKMIVITVDELAKLIDERLEATLGQFLTGQKQEEDQLLSRKEVADLFGVSLVTINEWCRKGILIPHHMNSRVYFYKSEVLEALSGSKYGKRRYK